MADGLSVPTARFFIDENEKIATGSSKDKLNVVSVHMPRSENDLDIELVKKVVEEHGITQPILVDNEHKITDVFENQYVPAYYVFDAEGKLRHFQAGGSGMKMLEKRVNRVLEENEKTQQ